MNPFCTYAWYGPLAVLLGVIFADQAAVAGPSPAKPSSTSCVRCHSDSNLLVTNKKLYDYYQRWVTSVHAEKSVGCVDCHGGNLHAAGKAEAHQGIESVDAASSRTNFRNIPRMCGQCHEEKLRAFVRSDHYERLTGKDEEQRGPNCITCHGSLNARALDVNTVRRTCQQCHNEKTDNHPGIPATAEELLNDFNAIRGYLHFIYARGNAKDVAAAKSGLVPLLKSLSDDWHTFDLDRISVETRGLVSIARGMRDEVRAHRSAKGGETPEQ